MLNRLVFNQWSDLLFVVKKKEEMYVCTRVADKMQWKSRGKNRERRTPGLTGWRRRSFAVFLISCQGYPNDCFLWIICSKKQILPRIFFLRTTRNFWMTVPFRYNFRIYFINPHYNFLKFNFSHFTRYAGLNPKIFLFKNVMERGLRKNLIFVKRQIASNTFGKLILYDKIRYFI